MNYETLQELAYGHISDLVDQLAIHQSNGDEMAMHLVHLEIKELTEALDSEDATDNFFYAPRLRYMI